MSDKGFDDGPSKSIELSREKNAFLVEVQVSPKFAEMDGVLIDFHSAWIERNTKTTSYNIWWKRTIIRPGQHLVIRTNNKFPENYFLQLSGKQSSYSMHGTEVIDEDLGDLDYQKGWAKLFLAKDWKEPRDHPISVIWAVPVGRNKYIAPSTRIDPVRLALLNFNFNFPTVPSFSTFGPPPTFTEHSAIYSTQNTCKKDVIRNAFSKHGE